MFLKPIPSEIIKRNEKKKELSYSNIKEMTANSLEELSYSFNPVNEWKFKPVYSQYEIGTTQFGIAKRSYVSDFFLNNIFKYDGEGMDLNVIMKDKISYSSIRKYFKENASNKEYDKKDLFYNSINNIIDNNFDNLYETEWGHISDEEMEKILVLLEKDLKMLLTDSKSKGVL